MGTVRVLHDNPPVDQPGAKVCTKCNEEKPLSEFYAHKKSKDGYAWWCKGCYRARYAADPEGCNAATLRWREEHRDQWNAARRRRHDRLRREVIAAYGGACTCCGEEEEAFLSLEHLDGVPDEHRRANGERKSSTDIYALVRRAGFPLDYTVLCMNCNTAKGRYGVCPHEQRRLRVVGSDS
jgi:hypothetical protein